MSEFDDVIEKGKKRPSSEEVEEKKEFKRSKGGEEIPPISLSSMLEDEPLLADLTGNINPELKTQVLIPLLNIVEKYGMAENIVASERTQTSLALVGVLSDVAPVIKGLSNYLEGHRNSLNQSDKEFLEQLQDLESSDDLEGLFNSENEMVVESPKRQHSLLGELPDVDLNQGPVDWMAILDPQGNFSPESKTSREMDLDVMKLTTKKEDRPKIRLPSIDDLAAEAGIDLNAIEEVTPPSTKKDLSAESEITPVKIDEFLDVEEVVEETPINNNDRDIPIVSFDIPLNPKPVQNNPIQEEILNEED
tara:strand:- start:8549 stop:9466 length:918 start_codon:yes stop_codon:yes gene_type:complete